MEQYEECQDEDGNIIRRCPVHNYYASPIVNQKNYIRPKMISPNYEKIYTSPRKIEQYNNNYIITSSNQSMVNENEYPQYSYENNQNVKYVNQYYKQRNNNDNYNINNTNSSTNNTNSSLRKYESSDGVLRGYTNNYSFYVSGSSQIKPKVTINTQYNNNYTVSNTNNNSQNNSNQNKRQIIYKNSPQQQRNTGQYQRVIITNNNTNINNNRNYENRQIVQNDNSSYIIRMVENEPEMYNQPNKQYINSNYNVNNYNNNVEEEIYYINENDNRNIIQQTNYHRPLIQRRMVKRVVDREPFDRRKDNYIIGPKDNLRNVNKNNQYSINNYQQKTIYQKVNNNNLKKFYSSNINSNINQRNDYFAPYPLKRTNTPNITRPNLTSNISYVHPTRQQKIMVNSPNFYGPKNSNNNIPYYSRESPYNAYTENNDYYFSQTEANSPRTRTPFIARPPIMDNVNNVYIYPTRREREFTSRTQLQNQGGYEFEYENNENDDDDDVYEVPEQYSNNMGFYEDRRQNISERPFTQVSNYSQSERNGRKYAVYTQTLAMNRNYNYDDEFEVDRRDVRNMRRRNNNYNNRNNYSVPKIMRPINDVQRLVRQNREYSAFERSLRNIRDNEEEIELENEERNNRVKIKTSGSNNHRLFISNNSKGRHGRKYKTYTELQNERPQGYYILEDIDNNSPDEYEIPPNENINRKVIKNNNLRIIQLENENIYRPPPPQYHPEEENNFYEEENMERFQNINTQQTQNEENEDDDNNDENEQIYNSNQLTTAKEDNFRIVHNNQINRRQQGFNQKQLIQNSQNSDENEQMQDNEIEGEEHEEEIIQQTNTNTNSNMEEDIYQREDSPQDRDEQIPPEKKNVKNIQTEINEKYYDNQGKYLGEKKIITTKQVPVNNQNQTEEYNPQQEEGDYQDEQEEQEDENENVNDNEYTPYQSNNKKFKKRGENNKNMIESKYHSYFGDSNNNVYYEIKGMSGEVNKEEESKNDEEIEKRNYNEPMVQVKNVNFGIQSKNLCVPAQENEIEDKDNDEDKGNNDEKEADEQQIDENAEIYEEEEEDQNNFNEKKKIYDEQNYNGNNNENENIIENINTNINENINTNEKEIEQINENNIEEENDINQNIDLNQEEYEINNYKDIQQGQKENDIQENNIQENIIQENNIQENNIQENIDNNYIEEINSRKNEINNNEENEINNNDNVIQYAEKNINININQNNVNDIYENENENNIDNVNNKRNNIEFNEVEQIVEENEAEEIENQNIQKDEGEEEDIGEGLVEMEENNNFNYEENEMDKDEEGYEEEQKIEFNENNIEEENINNQEDDIGKEN